MFKSFALGAFVTAVAPNQAAATTYSVSSAISTTGPSEVTFHTPTFNDGLGTLTGVSFAFSGILATSVPFIETSSKPPPFTATLRNNVFGVGGGWMINPPMRLADSTGSSNGTSFTGSPIAVAFSATASDLTEYVGIPPVEGYLRFTSSFLTTSLGNTLVGGETFDAFQGSVLTTFTYTSVPEPATLAVISIGMLGLARYRRRA